jgi:hypothetical protein
MPVKTRAQLLANILSTDPASMLKNIIDSLGLDVRLFVTAYGATGDGVTDDTAAIQACLDAAAVVAAARRGCTVYFPFGVYLVSAMLAVRADGIELEGVLAGGDPGTGAAIITPTAGFANGGYIFNVSNSDLERSLSGVVMRDLMIGKIATLANTVHGVYWQVYNGDMQNVHIGLLSGNGLVLEGYDASNQAYQNSFSHLEINQCGGDAIVAVANTPDHWFSDCSIHGNQAGYSGGCSAHHFVNCHFWGNVNNLKLAAGGAFPKFIGCAFREPSQHNVLLDGSAVGSNVTNFLFEGCIFRTATSLAADDTYDNIAIIRTASNGVMGGLIANCIFVSAGANDVRYHINLSGIVATDVHVSNCKFDGNAATAKLNHASTAVRCLVNNLGINAGDPNSAGQWTGLGEEGVMVYDTVGGDLYLYSLVAAAWLPIYTAP